MPSSNHRVLLVGSHRPLPPYTEALGPVDPTDIVDVTVRVRPKPAGKFLPSAEPAGSLPLRERRHMSRAEFEASHGADVLDLNQVEAFAHRYGLSVTEQSPARRSVSLSGTAAAMGAAFGVNLQRCSHPDGEFRTHTGPVLLPADLQPIVEGVFGLDDRPQAKTHFRIKKPKPGRSAAPVSGKARSANKPTEAGRKASGGSGGTSGDSGASGGETSGGYSPVQIARAYDFPAGSASGQCIAIIELGGGYRGDDLDAYFAEIGLAALPQVSAVSVDGGGNQPTGNPDGPDGEVMLDIEVAAAVAPGSRIVVYFAPNTDRGFLDAVTTAIHDNIRKPSVLSISWGSAEANWTQQAMAAMDQAFQAAAAMGITVCVAAGDNGSTDGEPGSEANVDFPASSPHVLACGGTRLLIPASGDGSIAQETVWNDGDEGGATGGGVSGFFGKPTWQMNVGVPPSVNPGKRAGRGLPDICGDADPETGYLVRVDGQDMVIGGTSAVAPLWAGLIALMNQNLGHPAGYLNPLLYQVADEGGLRDIVEGNNGQYSAKKGWDACTGLGSPRGRALFQSLASPQVSETPAA